MLMEIFLNPGMEGEPLVVIYRFHEKLKIRIGNYISQDTKLFELKYLIQIAYICFIVSKKCSVKRAIFWFGWKMSWREICIKFCKKALPKRFHLHL